MKKIIILSVFLFAFIERVFYDFGPNIELITLSTLLSAAYLGKRFSLLATFLLMLATDLVIGNSNIYIFTWSGFLVPAFFASEYFKRQGSGSFKKVGGGALMGIASTAFFYLWTNFGVWLLGTMYPKTAFGLVSSYINALPFLRFQAVSTLVFVPLGFAITEAAIYLNKKYFLQKRIRSYFSGNRQVSNSS